MKLPVVILVVTFLAIMGATVLFNVLDASPEIRVAVWGFIMMVGGGAAGVFGDRFPELPRWLTDYRRDAPPRH